MSAKSRMRRLKEYLMRVRNMWIKILGNICTSLLLVAVGYAIASLGYKQGYADAINVRREEIAAIAEKVIVEKEVDCVMGVK
jgi:uncharacterized protein (DUF2164 family)